MAVDIAERVALTQPKNQHDASPEDQAKPAGDRKSAAIAGRQLDVGRDYVEKASRIGRIQKKFVPTSVVLGDQNGDVHCVRGKRL